jgi:hypothetical protein
MPYLIELKGSGRFRAAVYCPGLVAVLRRLDFIDRAFSAVPHKIIPGVEGIGIIAAMAAFDAIVAQIAETHHMTELMGKRFQKEKVFFAAFLSGERPFFGRI